MYLSGHKSFKCAWATTKDGEIFIGNSGSGESGPEVIVYENGSCGPPRIKHINWSRQAAYIASQLSVTGFGNFITGFTNSYLF